MRNIVLFDHIREVILGLIVLGVFRQFGRLDIFPDGRGVGESYILSLPPSHDDPAHAEDSPHCQNDHGE